MGRVFASDPLEEMVLETSLLNTKHYTVRIKGKWSNLGKRIALSLYLGVVAIEKGAIGSPSTTVTNFTYFIYIYICVCVCVCVCVCIVTIIKTET